MVWMNNRRGCNLKPIIEKRYFYWNVLLLSFPAPPTDREAKYNSSGKHHSFEIFFFNTRIENFAFFLSQWL